MVSSAQISILNILKGGQARCRDLSPPYFLLLEDDILVLWVNISSQEFLVPGARMGVVGIGLQSGLWYRLVDLDLVGLWLPTTFY